MIPERYPIKIAYKKAMLLPLVDLVLWDL